MCCPCLLNDKGHQKHLENGLMMFTTKENCTFTVKDYLVYKNKTNKNTADKCIKPTMYPDSHT